MAQIAIPGLPLSMDESLIDEISRDQISQHFENQAAQALAARRDRKLAIRELIAGELVKALGEPRRLKGGPGSGNRGHAGRPGKVGGSAPRSGGGIQDSPEFKKWFKKSKVVDAQGNPLVVFHGTQADFQEFRNNPDSVMMDRGLGFHFAEDPDISGRFALGLYGDKTGWGDYKLNNGNVMPVYLSIQKPRVIKEEKGRFDQYLIEKDMVGVVFKDNKPLFLEWWKDRWAGTESEELGSKVFDRLSSGGEVSEAEFGRAIGLDKKSWAEYDGTPYGLAAYIMNAGLGFGLKKSKGAWMIQEYIKRLKAMGYDGIVYQNTSPMETGEIDMTFPGNEESIWSKKPKLNFPASRNRTTWIAFDPGQVKSAFNQGTFDPKNPNILKENMTSVLAAALKGKR